MLGGPGTSRSAKPPAGRSALTTAHDLMCPLLLRFRINRTFRITDGHLQPIPAEVPRYIIGRKYAGGRPMYLPGRCSHVVLRN